MVAGNARNLCSLWPIAAASRPHVDGRKVALAVKAVSPSTPVILLAGWGERLTAEGEIPPRVDLLLGKPPKLRQLREALARCAEANGSPNQA